VRGRQSLCATAWFITLMSTLIALLLALLAFTPVGGFVLLNLLGVTAEVAKGARAVLAILVPLPFVTGLRGFAQGLVSQTRRTGLISFATGVRIGALFLVLWLGHGHFTGARLGAVALLGCVVTETLLISWFAWRVYRFPGEGAEEHDFAGVVRFAWPLVSSSGLQQAVPLIINAIISRFPDGTLALAAFGVVRGFIFLLAGPMRNLQQACLTLLRQADDYRVMARFADRVSLALGLLTLLIAGPLNTPVLGDIMGLDATLRGYIRWPLAACALYPWLIGVTHLQRGWFSAEHLTGLVGRATLYKVLLLLACWPPLAFLPPLAAGTTVAITLLVGAELFEAWYLHARRRRLLAARIP
jgi:hypothetical protein